MKYRNLGNSGLSVSRICLGTMTFGMADWGCDAEEAEAMTRRFVEAGGNFIDTADMYSAGRAEEITRQAIRDFPRDNLVLASKCWFRTNPSPNARGLSRKHILEAIDASLRRLGTDYLDLYQVHGPDPHTPVDETMRTLDSLVQCGKVRYIGCSNYFGWQIAKANGVADRYGWNRFVSGQHMYNLLRRDIEREILPACADQGMGMLCWSPLGGGMLTGKYRQASGPEPESRVGLRKEIDLPRYWNDDSFQVIEAVIQAATKLNRTPSQVALAWLLADQRVTSVILGARTVAQLESGLVAGDWDLPAGDRAALSEVVKFAHGYPQEWIDLTWPNIARSDST